MRPAQCGFHCATGQVSCQVVHLSQPAEKCDRVINALFKNKKSYPSFIETADAVGLSVYLADPLMWTVRGSGSIDAVLEIW
jgi:hypothetical protein